MKDEQISLKSNLILGKAPCYLENYKVVFKGNNNILYCENGVELDNCNITFEEDNALLYLSKSDQPYRLNVSLGQGAVCYIGENNRFNKAVDISLTEYKNILIGSGCSFSYGVSICATEHILYSYDKLENGKGMNSIFIGDRVWIGRKVLVLKGTRIGSGSVVGADSVVAGSNISSNTLWGGNTARMMAGNVYVSNAMIHHYHEDEPMTDELKKYVFEEDINKISYIEIDEGLRVLNSAQEKLQYIRENIVKNVGKNRFYSNGEK